MDLLGQMGRGFGSQGGFGNPLGSLSGLLGGKGGVPTPFGQFNPTNPFGGGFHPPSPWGQQQRQQQPPDWYTKPPSWWNQGPGSQQQQQPTAPRPPSLGLGGALQPGQRDTGPQWTTDWQGNKVYTSAVF